MKTNHLLKNLVLYGILSTTGLSPAFAKTEIELIKEQLEHLTQRLKLLEQRQSATTDAQANPVETDLIDRVSGLENAVDSLNKSSPLRETFERVSVGGGLVAVGQSLSNDQSAGGSNASQINYRGDVEIEVGMGDFGFDGLLAGASSKLFTQIRFGQGSGVQLARPTFTGAVNSTAFQLSGNSENSTALIAQAWYQMNVPVSRFGDLDSLEITAGKIDPFVFFDNNPIADNEAEQFLNNVFVHNALLDSGGDIGADEYGFSPGFRAAYTWDVNSTDQWTASIGLFGSGNGATYSNSLTDPFSIIQLQYEGKALMGKAGFYQMYAWRNPQANNALNSALEVHSGIGVSAYQAINKSLALFSRLGVNTTGVVSFDRTWTVGGEFNGRNWHRANDRIGLAVGRLRASEEYVRTGSCSGAETNAELFYAWHLNDHLQLTPSVQYINKPAGVQDGEGITIVGLRTAVSF